MAVDRVNQVLIALGANLGNRSDFISKARALIDQFCGPVLAHGPILETAPMGAADQPFLNSALICETALEPLDLLASLQAIEKQLGRVRKVRWGNRTIDLDIILWRQTDGTFLNVTSPALTIPHPAAADRVFVLEPAVAIAPHWVFTDGASVADKWHRLRATAFMPLRDPSQNPLGIFLQ